MAAKRRVKTNATLKNAGTRPPPFRNTVIYPLGSNMLMLAVLTCYGRETYVNVANVGNAKEVHGAAASAPLTRTRDAHVLLPETVHFHRRMYTRFYSLLRAGLGRDSRAGKSGNAYARTWRKRETHPRSERGKTRRRRNGRKGGGSRGRAVCPVFPPSCPVPLNVGRCYAVQRRRHFANSMEELRNDVPDYD